MVCWGLVGSWQGLVGFASYWRHSRWPAFKRENDYDPEQPFGTFNKLGFKRSHKLISFPVCSERERVVLSRGLAGVR